MILTVGTMKWVYSSSMITVINGTNEITSELILSLNERILAGRSEWKSIGHVYEWSFSLSLFISHVTPEHQAVYTSTDSSVISPPMRHTPVEAMPDHREIHNPSTPYQPATINSSRPPSTGPPGRPYPYASKNLLSSGCAKAFDSVRSFSDGYISPTVDSPYRSTVAPSVTSSLSRPRMSLSRAAVDVVDGKSMLRYCRLNTEPGQTFGFELAQDENRHIIRNVKPDSPAGRWPTRSTVSVCTASLSFSPRWLAQWGSTGQCQWWRRHSSIASR